MFNSYLPDMLCTQESRLYVKLQHITIILIAVLDLSRRGSFDVSSHTEVLVVREKRLVNSYAVKSGMLRFNFMLDCCQPGSIPDPHLIAAVLDLVNSDI